MDDGHVTSEDSVPLGILIKRSIYGAFYMMQKDMRLGKRYFYISTIAMVLQLLYFPVAQRANFAWPPVVTDKIAYMFEIYDYSFLEFSSEWVDYFLMAISAFAVSLGVAGIVMLSIDEAQSTSHYSSIIPFLEVLLRTLQTIFLIPTVAIFVKMITCPSNLSFCTNTASVVLQILGVLLLLVLLVITSLTSLFMIRFTRFNEAGKVVDGCFGAPHGRVEFLNTWIRAILSLTCASIPVAGTISTSGQAIWIALQTSCAIVLVAMYFHYLPFLAVSWNQFCVGAYAVYFWACVSLIVTEIINDPNDLTARILFLFMLPVVIYTLVSLMDRRIRYLSKPGTELIMLNAYLAEVRLRLLYVKENANGIFEFTKDIEIVCREAIEAYPMSAYLKLYVAELCSNSKRIIFALNLIREAREARVSIDQEFFLYCLNKRNMERNNESSGAASFMTFDSHVTTARETIASTLKLTAKFWKMLGRGKFTVNELIAHGARIHHDAQICKHHISRLLSLSRSSPEALRLHATYVNYILNDQMQASRILERQGHSTDDSGGYAVCTVSGNLDSLGKVMDVTQAMCTMFGYTKKDMIGRNVNFLCPPPFDRMHDNLLKQFLSIDADFETKTRQIYGLHSEGYLLPVDFVITPSTNADSDLIFIGKFGLRNDPTKHLLMVDVNSNVVTACSQNAPSILGVDVDEIFAMNVHILDVIPDFFSDDQGNSKYYSKTVERTATVNRYVLQVDAKKLLFDSKAESPIVFKLGVILITLKVLSNTGESDDEDSLAAEMDDSEGEVAIEEGDDQFEENSTLPLLGNSGNPAEAPQENNTAGASFNLNSLKVSADGFTANGKPRIKSKATKSVKSGKSGTRSASGAKSMATGSVSSSLTDSAEFSITKIHRLIAYRLKKKDPRVARYSRFVKYFTLVCIFLAIIRVVAVSIWYKTFANRIDDLYVSFERTNMLMSIAMIVELARNTVITFGTSVFYRLLPLNSTTTLLTDLTEVRTMHDTLVESTAYPDSVRRELLYTANMSQTQDGVNFEKVSFHMAFLEFMGHVENYVKTDNEVCSESCRYILNNGPFALFEESLLHSAFYYQQVLDVSSSILKVAVISIWIIVLFLGVAFVFGFVPMFKLSNRRKEDLGNAFVSIPPATIRMLQRRAERRVRTVQAATTTSVVDTLNDDENNDYNEEVDVAIGENHKFKGNEDPLNLKRQVSSAKHGDGMSSIMRILCCKCRKASKVGPNRVDNKINPDLSSTAVTQKKVELRRESTFGKMLNFTLAVLQVGFIFWFVLLFFCVISYIDFIEAPILKTTVAELYISGMRENVLDGLNFWSIQDSNGTSFGFRSDYNDQLGTMVEYYDTAKLYDESLRLGNESLDVGSFDATSGNLYDLYFVDTCTASCIAVEDDPRNAAQPTDISMVEDLRHGLVLALQRYWITDRDIIQAKTTLQANPTNANELAFYEAQAALNNLPLYFVLAEKAQLAMTYYKDAVVSEVNSIRALKISLLSIFSILMVVIYFMTLRLFKKMDKELKDSQTLLFMLPLEVFEEVPEMQALVNGDK